MNAQRIVVGLSGGVDSAVAAWMLRQQGHEVVGVFMKNWEDDDDSEYCSSREDWIDAASVADVLGIELDAVNFAAEYRERVFASFLDEYRAGRTPNPDILCNAEIKFKAFLDHAVRLGATQIATGHYARTDLGPDGAPRLLKGLDPAKDQSYFLHRLSADQLRRAVFPLGGLHKTEVRRLALEIGLPNARKKDSTGICFIGERPFRAFLSRYLPTQPGPMVDDSGRLVGEHIGLSFYTLGQRKGLGIGGARAGSGEAWFVAGKDLARNTLLVVQGHDHPLLLSRTVDCTAWHWIGTPPPGARMVGAKTRYRQADAAAELAASDGTGALRAAFAQPQWAVTPGQSLVAYDGAVCLGGGIITADSAPACAAQ